MDQLIRVAGALAISLAYVLAQLRVLDQHALPYLALNVAGALVLAVLAYPRAAVGFLLLEACGPWSPRGRSSPSPAWRREPARP